MIDLSIAIPTFNRQEWIIGRIRSLHSLLSPSGISYEIIISDNHSFPPVEYNPGELVQFQNKTMLVKPDKHYTKAEENYFFALQYCSGRYIWVLGDDDPPNRAGIDILVAAIKEDKYSLLVFDCNKAQISGELCNGALFDSSSEKMKDICDFIKRYGFWYTLAGFSNSVFKNPKPEDYSKAQSIMAICPIYAHVFWLTSLFWDKSFLYSPTPLVCYYESRRDANDSDHWPKLAKQEGVFATYYWTVGFARQIKYLRREINLPIGWLCDVWDIDWSGRRHPILNKVCFIFWHEIVMKSKIARSATPSEMKEMCDFLVEENPKFEYFASYLSKHQYETSELQKNRAAIDAFTHALLENPLFDYYLGNHKGYLLYQYHDEFVAIHGRDRNTLPSFFTGNTCPEQEFPFSARTLNELKEKIDHNHPRESRVLMENSDVLRLPMIECKLSRIEEELAIHNKTVFYFIKQLIPKRIRTLIKRVLRITPI